MDSDDEELQELLSMERKVMAACEHKRGHIVQLREMLSTLMNGAGVQAAPVVQADRSNLPPLAALIAEIRDLEAEIQRRRSSMRELLKKSEDLLTNLKREPVSTPDEQPPAKKQQYVAGGNSTQRLTPVFKQEPFSSQDAGGGSSSWTSGSDTGGGGSSSQNEHQQRQPRVGAVIPDEPAALAPFVPPSSAAAAAAAVAAAAPATSPAKRKKGRKKTSAELLAEEKTVATPQKFSVVRSYPADFNIDNYKGRWIREKFHYPDTKVPFSWDYGRVDSKIYGKEPRYWVWFRKRVPHHQEPEGERRSVLLAAENYSAQNAAAVGSWHLLLEG